MTRFFRILLRISLVSLTTITLAVALLYWQRLEVAQQILNRLADRFGFQNIEITIEKLDFDNVILRKIDIGPDLKADSIIVDLNFLSPFAPKADSVEIKGLSVDIGALENGAIQKIHAILDSQPSSDSTETELPEIIITDMRIFGKMDNIELDSTLNGHFSPSSGLDIENRLNGRFDRYTVQSLELKARLDPDFRQLALEIKKLQIVDQAENPIFYPLQLTAKGNADLKDFTFNLGIKEEKQNLRLSIAGKSSADFQQQNIQITVPETTISTTGWQPAHLTPLARDIPVLDLTLSGVFDILREGSKNKLNAAIKIKDSPLIQPLELLLHGDQQGDTLNLGGQGRLDNVRKNQLLVFSGEYDIAKGKGQINAAVPTLDFATSGLKAKDISPLLQVLQKIEGKTAAQSTIIIHKDDIKASGEITFDGLTLATDTLDLQGLSGTLAFSDLLKRQTKGIQKLEISRIDAGVPILQPHISFSMNGDVVNLHRLDAGLIDGHVRVANFRFDPNAKQHDLSIQLDRIDLAQLFDLIALDGLSGTGKLTGTIPLSLRENNVFVQDGLLQTVDAGVLRFRSKQAKQALGSAGEQVDLLLQVLSNFHYEHLSLRLNQQEAGKAEVMMKIQGRNPEVMESRPFNLNINLQGNLDRLLERLWDGYRLSDRAIRATFDDRE